MYWETAIPAPEAPTPALQYLLDTLTDAGQVRAVPDREQTALLDEAARWAIPLRRDERGLYLEYPHAALATAEVAAAAHIAEDRIRILRTCASTNADLLASDLSPSICLAESQWAGRGRRGRRWSSPFGLHLALSFGWTQATPVNPALTLVAALAIFPLLHKSLPELWVKWPNDLWVGQQKLGGLLVEARSMPGGQTRLVVGFGLNIHADASLPAEATSLAEQGIALSRSILAGQIIQRWQEAFAELDAAGFVPFLRLWKEAAAPILGQTVQITDPAGSYPARVLDLADDGRLQVQHTDASTHWLSAGEVSLRPLAP